MTIKLQTEASVFVQNQPSERDEYMKTLAWFIFIFFKGT